jgi:hypothetical protein
VTSRRLYRSFLVLLFLAAPAFSQDPKPPEPTPAPPTVKLAFPPTVSTPVNFPIGVKPSENTGGTVRWFVADPGLQEYDLSQLLGDPEKAKAYSEEPLAARMYWSAKPGRYRVLGVSAKGDLTSPFAVCVIVVGDVPPIPPGPTPVPPGPTPPGPTPSPAPIPADGLRVMIIYDRNDLARYPAAQVAAMQSKKLWDYLSANCAKGPDGVTPEWRVWSKEVDATNESKLWRDAFARKRGDMPWIIVSNGKTGFEGPCAKTADEIIEQIKLAVK